MYITTAWSKVCARTPRRASRSWKFDPKVPGERAVSACCDVVNRGVAVWNGQVYCRHARRPADRARREDRQARSGRRRPSTRRKPYTITGAPRVVKDKVLIGNGGAEFGVRGYVTAYDADTGKTAGASTPRPTRPRRRTARLPTNLREQGDATWSDKGEWKTSGGGGTVWDAIVYDQDLDQLFIGVGNGSPWNQATRSDGKGDNLFLSSIVALDPDTGDYKWHYQDTPGETWDFTATQPIMLADLTIDGRRRKVLYAGAEERLLLCDRPHQRQADRRQTLSLTGSTGRPAMTSPPAVRSKTPNCASTRPASPASRSPARSARTTGIR